MKKLLLSALFFPCLIANAQAPVFHWAKTAGSLGYDTGRDIAIDGQGNVIVVGSFDGPVDFDPGPNQFVLTAMGNHDGFIQKLDANGNFLWAKQISGSMIESTDKIALDASGNIYIAGEYMDTVDFNPGPGFFYMTSTTHTIPSLKSIDVYVEKLDPNGNFLWAKSMGGAEYDALKSMKLDAAGNIILGGYFALTADFNPGPASNTLTSVGSNDIYFCKLDSNGNYIWAKSMGGTGEESLGGMTIDSSGNVYGTGFFIGPADFNPDSGIFNLQPSAPDPLNGVLQDIFIVKLDSNGSFGWAKKIGDNKGEMAQSIAIDNSGNVITAGFYTGNVDFDPGAGEYLLNSPTNAMYISKLNPDGDFVSAQKISGTNLISPDLMQVDNEGSLYIAGEFHWVATFGPTEDMVLTAVSNDEQDIFIAKYDATGNPIWAKAIGGPEQKFIYGIKVTPDGSVYSTGAFNGNTDMDPGTGVFNVVSGGSGDLFVHRLTPENLAVAETVKLEMVIYPNPSNGTVNITVPESRIGAVVRVYTITGQKIKEFTLDALVTQQEFTTGIYFVEAIHNDAKTVTKLVVR